jgi:hypothetical protein
MTPQFPEQRFLAINLKSTHPKKNDFWPINLKSTHLEKNEKKLENLKQIQLHMNMDSRIYLVSNLSLIFTNMQMQASEELCNMKLTMAFKCSQRYKLLPKKTLL